MQCLGIYYANLPRFPPPLNPSLPCPRLPISKNSPRLIFLFWPAPLPIEFVVLVLCLLVWLSLAALLDGRVIVIDGEGLCDLWDTIVASRVWPRLSDRLRSERFISAS